MSSDDKTRIFAPISNVTVGTQLSGIYELDERIASGGMGEVYRGHNIQTGDHVAIKIVLPEFARDQTILSLFRKEASILNGLSHDAIVRYHVFTIDPGIGRPYLAMEFVNGDSLFDVMSRGPMAAADVRRLGHRLASGLSAAHEAGTVHRDLSPDNIILPGGKVERAKIIDFGIARSAAGGGETLIGGKFAGKYNYVSPEQLGLFGGEVSERSDIYSLGLVLAAALRGKALDMSGSQLEILEKRRSVPDLSDIDEGFRPTIEAMLQPDPFDRPASMADIADAMSSGAATVNPRMISADRPRLETTRASQVPPPGKASSEGGQTGRFVAHIRPAHLSSSRPPPTRSAAEGRTGDQSRPWKPRPVTIAGLTAAIALAAAGTYWVMVVNERGPSGGSGDEVSQLTPVLPQAPSADTAAVKSGPNDKATQVPAKPDQETPPKPATPAATALTEPAKPAEPPAKVDEAKTPETRVATNTPQQSPQVVQKAKPPDTIARVQDSRAASLPPGKAAEPSEPLGTVTETKTPDTRSATDTPPKTPQVIQKPKPADIIARARDSAGAGLPPRKATELPEPVTPKPTVEAHLPSAKDRSASSQKNAVPPSQELPARVTPSDEANSKIASANTTTPSAAPAPTRKALEPPPVIPPAKSTELPPASTDQPAAAKENTPPNEQEVAVYVPEPARPQEAPEAAIDDVAERITWLRDYREGGDCFFATATSATDKAIAIEGFGTDVEPFARMLEAFQAKFHIEPDISVRLIDPAQCEVPHFLRALSASAAERPELVLDRTSIPNGSPISGSLSTRGGLRSSLLLIDHRGMAFNLDDRVTIDSGKAVFSIPIGLGPADLASGKSVSQIIIAVTGATDLQAAALSKPTPASIALPQILAEIAGKSSEFSATAKYFRLGG